MMNIDQTTRDQAHQWLVESSRAAEYEAADAVRSEAMLLQACEEIINAQEDMREAYKANFQDDDDCRCDGCYCEMCVPYSEM